MNFDENNDPHDVIGVGDGKHVWSEWKDIERNWSLSFGLTFDDLSWKNFKWFL